MADPAQQRIVYSLPGMEQVRVQRNLVYKTAAGEQLGMDIYQPLDADGSPRPAVVFISGYPDPGFEKVVGCRFKEMGAYVSWAQLLACRGMVAVTYENTDPAQDALDAVQFLIDHAADYQIDPTRLAIWSCSGNVPCAVNLMCAMPEQLRCAVLCYGFLLDLDGSTSIAEASAQYRFVNAAAGRSITEIGELPLLLVRAGQDEFPGLNDSLDRFVAQALADGLRLSLINHPDGVHAFDLSDNSDYARQVIEAILDYLQVLVN
jgi:dienelactone hydrolase